jgi:hypothetical protein
MLIDVNKEFVGRCGMGLLWGRERGMRRGGEQKER